MMRTVNNINRIAALCSLQVVLMVPFPTCVLQFLSCMHVNQGAKRIPQGTQPPAQANPKLSSTAGKQFKGKSDVKIRNNFWCD